MKMRMHFKITLPGARPVSLALALAGALAAAPPAAQGPMPLPVPPSAVPVPPPAAPAPGPIVDLPPERDMPSTALPRETPIENPLGGAPVLSGTAVGGYGELTLNAPSVGPATVDLRRFVLFVGHNFTDRI